MEEKRKARYQKMLEDTRHEIGDIDALIQRELDEVKARITSLQKEKDAHLNIYSSYCQLLGVPNDLDEVEEEEEEDM